MTWTVSEVAGTAGVTVRTLHHYDDIGLLVPSARSQAGYRLYSYEDLQRLQQILAYRRLGMGLDEIGAVLDDPDADPVDHLRRQHALLSQRRDELTRVIEALEKTMQARKLGIELSPEELFEVFGEDDPGRDADEVVERWGDSDAFRESRRRASQYGKADWERMKAEADDHNRRLVVAFRAGHAAGSPEAMELAEEHRLHVSRWFYDCPPSMHRALGERYVADARFTKTYEDLAEGLTPWVREAWAANADRQEAAQDGS